MKFKRLAAAIVLAVATAGVALARNDPPPPPSGIVVHLFGPQSIASQILPNGMLGPRPPAAGSAPGNAAAGSAGAGGVAGTVMSGDAAAPTAGSTDADYQEPTMHQILHEMFITGDPNLKPGDNLATGRRNDHP